MIPNEPDSLPIEEDPIFLDPYRQIFGNTMYFVESAAGTQKTRSAIRYAILQMRMGNKVVFAMPTIPLIGETVEKTIPGIAKEMGVVVEPVVIHSDNGQKGTAIADRICAFIGKAEGGQILFITHEGMHRVIEWPEEAKNWHLIIDEVFDPLLSSGLLKLRYSHFNLGRPERLERGFGFIRAKKLIATLGDEKAKDEYYHVVPILDYENHPEDPWFPIRMHVTGQENDQVYELFKDIPLWMLQKEALLTHAGNWDKMTGADNGRKSTNPRGYITISGFRRPERLFPFRRVTIMSALFQSTLLHHVWSRLGIQFKPSPDITVNIKTTALGPRQLSIGYLTDAAWSKRSRDRSGGIAVIFDVIAKSKFINRSEKVGIVINKEDSANPDVMAAIRRAFPHYELLPHNVRGSNEWTHLRQLIHCAALNPRTTDIQWAERSLGIDSVDQRLARVGQEIYQTFMRLNIRLPQGTANLRLVTMEKLLAEATAVHFVPQDQIEITQIDDEGKIYRPKPVGRPSSGKTQKERNRINQQARRDRQRAKKESGK